MCFGGKKGKERQRENEISKQHWAQKTGKIRTRKLRKNSGSVTRDGGKRSLSAPRVPTLSGKGRVLTLPEDVTPEKKDTRAGGEGTLFHRTGKVLVKKEGSQTKKEEKPAEKPPIVPQSPLRLIKKRERSAKRDCPDLMQG